MRRDERFDGSERGPAIGPVGLFGVVLLATAIAGILILAFWSAAAGR